MEKHRNRIANQTNLCYSKTKYKNNCLNNFIKAQIRYFGNLIAVKFPVNAEMITIMPHGQVNCCRKCAQVCCLQVLRPLPNHRLFIRINKFVNMLTASRAKTSCLLSVHRQTPLKQFTRKCVCPCGSCKQSRKLLNYREEDSDFLTGNSKGFTFDTASSIFLCRSFNDTIKMSTNKHT